jgi:ribosomal protein L37AE/L43A
MIELSPTTGFMLYLGATIAFLFAIWAMQHYRTRKKTVVTASQELFICEYCHFAYLQEFGRKVTQCPQCNSYNQQNAYKK